MTFLQKLLCAVLFCVLSINVFAGGEVPWPLAAQSALSEKSVRGTWYVQIQEKRYLYNIEIVRRNELWIWVRVSILNPKTMSVLAQGEGYFWDAEGISGPQKDGGQESSGGWQPDPGSYIFMRPVQNVGKGFFVRLVQLKGTRAKRLGVSVFENHKPENPISGIAHQIQDTPMICRGNAKENGNADPVDKDILCKLETGDFIGPWELLFPGLMEGFLENTED